MRDAEYHLVGICSMCFGGAMEVTGMLKKITSSFMSKVESAGFNCQNGWYLYLF